MSLLATIALAASGAALPACSWDRPGVNPFMGDVVAAVDRYTDIPADTRAKIKARMAKRDYDEIVTIGRDSISGKANYSNDIRDMHYGSGNVCRTVTRAKWAPTMQERGLVYCEDGQCILVPTVCRNVSRISRIAPRPGGGAAGGSAPPALAEAPEAPLEFEAPGAGPLAMEAPGAGPSSFSQIAGVPLGDPVPIPSGSIITPGGTPSGPGVVVPTPSLPLPPATPNVPNTPETPVIPPTTPEPPTVPQVPPVTPAVPEPGTWLLMLAGMAAVAFVARRRQARA